MRDYDTVRPGSCALGVGGTYVAAILGLLACASSAEVPSLQRVIVLDAGGPLPDAGRMAGVDAVVIQLLADGHSALAPAPAPFAPAGSRLPASVSRGIVQGYRDQGTRVLGGLDLLRWSNAADTSGLWASHSEWFELDGTLSCQSAGDPTRYASLWDDRVREELRDLTATIAQDLPELDGLLVHCAYSERGWMGYSPAARAAYIREAGGKKGLSLFPDCESNAGVGWACAKTRASCDSGPAAPRHPAGSRRADVLLGDDDRVRYRDLLQEYSERYGLTVLAYCLMTNHVHLVAVPRDEGLLSQVSKLAGRELVVRGRSRPRKPEEGDER